MSCNIPLSLPETAVGYEFNLYTGTFNIMNTLLMVQKSVKMPPEINIQMN